MVYAIYMNPKNKTKTNFSFANQLLALKAKTKQNLTKNDFKHLKKIIWVNRLFFLLGFGTAWIFPNPFSMFCIALGLFGQWTMVAHHVCHGGYDHVPGTPARYNSKRFGLGWRRFLDWPDVLYVPAWNYEHNVLHHFYTNEALDPDVPSVRIKHYLNEEWPAWRRFLFMCLNVCVWKITYYAPNLLKAYDEKKQYNNSLSPSKYYKKAIFLCYLPYFVFHFIFIPLLFLPLGGMGVLYVLINRLGAEIITNIHTFLTIVPNHAGEDIALQTKHFTNRDEFFIAQIESTCNYNTGGFWRDYFNGYLNYQIEHHLFPDLPMSQYASIQPEVKALCLQHGIRYKQESIFQRIKKTFSMLLKVEN